MPASSDHESLSAALAEGLRMVAGADALPLDMVGFSFGGVALAWLAAQHPGLARRLVIVGSGGLGTPHGKVVLGPVRKLEGAAREAANRANLLALMLHDPASVDAMALYLQEHNGFRGRLKVSPLVMPDRLLHILPRVAVPVDAIWGAHDQPHPDPAVQAAALRSVRPDAQVHVIAGAGHWVMYEQAEAFNAALLERLEDGRA